MAECKIAIVQQAPVFLDRDKTLARAVAAVAAAAEREATLVVFSEAFIAGYPAWIWRLRPGADWNACESLHALLAEQSVDLEAGDLQPLCDAAREHHITIVCGMNEIDGCCSRSTLYNTVVVILPDGLIANRHRKLMPTNPERMVWGMGDASGLHVVDTPAGRIGCLICWENYMPLARYALYAQGIQIYVAPTYDSGATWQATLQHIAKEGGCWVIGCGHLLRARDIPDDMPYKDMLYPDADEWINPGDSMIVAPGGRLVARPLSREEGILYDDLDMQAIRHARRILDVSGHYARPDLFHLRIDTGEHVPVELVHDSQSD